MWKPHWLCLDVSHLSSTKGEGVAYLMQLPASRRERRRWLLGLLVLQSMSSFVLDSYQDLLREHLVVTLFLTMLVGAGGNAGNQSAIKVIRGLVRPRPHQACSGHCL